MRDVFVEEVEIADPEEYVKKKFQGKDVSYDKTSPCTMERSSLIS